MRSIAPIRRVRCSTSTRSSRRAQGLGLAELRYNYESGAAAIAPSAGSLATQNAAVAPWITVGSYRVDQRRGDSRARFIAHRRNVHRGRDWAGGRELYRYQVNGPNATLILEKV